MVFIFTEAFKLDNIDVPYGVLHDQRLSNLSQEDNKLIFTFEINTYENNYSNDFYLKYKSFNYCKMIVNLVDEFSIDFSLFTPINSKGKFNGLSLGSESLINCLNDSNATFIGCKTDGFSFNIEFDVGFYNSKEFKKYKKYCTCSIEINTCNSVVWEWY